MSGGDRRGIGDLHGLSDGVEGREVCIDGGHMAEVRGHAGWMRVWYHQ